MYMHGGKVHWSWKVDTYMLCCAGALWWTLHIFPEPIDLVQRNSRPAITGLLLNYMYMANLLLEVEYHALTHIGLVDSCLEVEVMRPLSELCLVQRLQWITCRGEGYRFSLWHCVNVFYKWCIYIYKSYRKYHWQVHRTVWSITPPPPTHTHSLACVKIVAVSAAREDTTDGLWPSSSALAKVISWASACDCWA